MEAISLAELSRKEKLQLLEALEEKVRRDSRNKIATLFPDEGPLRRELYQKHLQFFKAGATYNERAFIAANRVGKTMAGAYEMSLHLSGAYPRWWQGRRFDEPVHALCAGTTAKTTRDILQRELLGEPGHDEALGTGLIPGALLLGTSVKHGLANCFESVRVRHVTGGVSVLMFHSFDQGRSAYEGTSKHVIWFDEEVPEDIYAEGLLRTLTTKGLVYLTFTALQGLTPLVLSFLPEMAPQAA